MLPSSSAICTFHYFKGRDIGNFYTITTERKKYKYLQVIVRTNSRNSRQILAYWDKNTFLTWDKSSMCILSMYHKDYLSIKLN